MERKNQLRLFVEPQNASGVVKFKGLHAVYIAGEDIFVVVEYANEFSWGHGDWIGLYPTGWNQLDQFVGYQQAPQPAKRDLEGHHFLYSFVFKTKSVQFLPSCGLFQFVYVSQSFGCALGASSKFSLDPDFSNCTINTDNICNQNYKQDVISAKKYGEGFNYNPEHHFNQQKQQQHLLIQTSDSRRRVQEFSSSYTYQQPSLMENRIASCHWLIRKEQQNICNRGVATVCEQNEMLKQRLEKSNDYNYQLVQNLQHLMERLWISEHQASKQINHIETLYYTMYKYGFEKLHLQNGDCINLSDYDGSVLKLERQNDEHYEESDFNEKKVSVDKATYTEHNDPDKFLRKIARLQLERDKIDDYISWLHSKAKKERYRHNIFSSQNHIYDEPCTDSSSGEDYGRQSKQTAKSASPAKRVQYSDSQTLIIDDLEDSKMAGDKKKSVQIRKTSSKDKNLVSNITNLKSSLSPQRRPRANSGKSSSSKKRRISRRESFFGNFSEKPQNTTKRSRRHSLNPFFLGVGRSPHNLHSDSSSANANSQRKSKVHII